jgi:hypothetical protein
MCKRFIALVLVLGVPASASAEPLAAAVEKAVREAPALARQQQTGTRSRGRFWSGLALLAGGAAMTVLGTVEIGDDETGPDDGEDLDGSDDGEDQDVNKALVGGGVAAAAAGGWLMITGLRSGPAVSARRGSVVVRHTIRF